MLRHQELGPGSTDPVKVTFHPPAEPLREAITAYYFLEIPRDGASDILHPEWFNLRLFRGGRGRIRYPGRAIEETPLATVTGTTSRAPEIWLGPGLVVAIGMLPYGWARLIGLSASEYADKARPLAEVLGAQANLFVSAVTSAPNLTSIIEFLDDFFLELASWRPEPPAIIQQAHLALMDQDINSVGAWASRLNMSSRHLERLALNYFGLTPKMLLRRQRFLRSLAAIREVPPGSWARLIDHHYSDQPQFSREFTFFMGVPPRMYFKNEKPIMQPASESRLTQLGEPAQALHPPNPKDR